MSDIFLSHLHRAFFLHLSWKTFSGFSVSWPAQIHPLFQKVLYYLVYMNAINKLFFPGTFSTKKSPAETKLKSFARKFEILTPRLNFGINTQLQN